MAITSLDGSGFGSTLPPAPVDTPPDNDGSNDPATVEFGDLIKTGVGPRPENPLSKHLAKTWKEREEKEQEESFAGRLDVIRKTYNNAIPENFENYNLGSRLNSRKWSIVLNLADGLHDAHPNTMAGMEFSLRRLSREMFDEPDMTLDQFFASFQEKAQRTQDKRIHGQRMHRTGVIDIVTGNLEAHQFDSYSPNEYKFFGDKKARRADAPEESEFFRDREIYTAAVAETYEDHGDIIPQVRQLFSMIKEDDISYRKIRGIMENLDDSQMQSTYELVALGVSSLPESEQNSIWENFKTQSARDSSLFGGKAWRGFWRTINRVTAPPPLVEGIVHTQSDRDVLESVREDENLAEGFLGEIVRLRDQSDPITHHAKEGTFLGNSERALYATTGVGVSVGIAMLPYVGSAATYGLLERSAYGDYYQRLVDSGNFSRTDAAEISSQVAPYVAALQLFPEMMGARGFTAGQWGKLNKTLDYIPDKFTNKFLRISTATAVAGAGEAVTEEIQFFLGEIGMDVISALEEDAPGGRWQELYDNFGDRNLQVFLSILPWSLIGVSRRRLNRRKIIRNFKGANPEQLAAAGYDPELTHVFMEAEEGVDQERALDEMLESNDPTTDKAKQAASAWAERVKNHKALVEETQKLGQMPSIVVSNKKKGYDIVDLDGTVIDTKDTPLEAATAVYAHVNLEGIVRQTRLDELAAQLEAMRLDVDTEKKGSAKTERESVFKLAELTPEKYAATQEAEIEKLDKKIKEAKKDETKKELEKERERLKVSVKAVYEELARAEKLLGGKNGSQGTDAGMGWRIDGFNLTTFEGDQRKVITELFEGASVFKVVHERAHSTLTTLARTNPKIYEEVLAAFQALDKTLIGLQTTADPDKVSQQLRFLPEYAPGEEVSQSDIQEAWAEFAEVMLLDTRNGKKSKMRKLLQQNLASFVESHRAGATTIKAMVNAYRSFFDLALSRSLHMKKAQRAGEVEAGNAIEQLRQMLQGTTAQEEYEQEVEEQRDKNQSIDQPFSISPRTGPIAPAFFSHLENVIGGLEDIDRITTPSVKGRSFPAKTIRGKDGKVIKEIAARTEPDKPAKVVTARETIVRLMREAGVKDEEIKWSGVLTKADQLAAVNDGKIPIKELQAWLATEGKVRFEETVFREKGEGMSRDPNDYDRPDFEGMDIAEMDAWYAETVGYSPLEDSPDMTEEDLRDLVIGFYNEETGQNDGNPRYGTGDLVLPGGKNYRETVLTMPTERGETTHTGTITFSPDEGQNNEHLADHFLMEVANSSLEGIDSMDYGRVTLESGEEIIEFRGLRDFEFEVFQEAANFSRGTVESESSTPNPLGKPKKITQEESEAYPDMEYEVESVLLYPDGVEIAHLKNGNYYLVLDREEFQNQDLQVLESMLLDWLIDEGMMPLDVKKKSYTSSHFSDVPNYVAHMRTADHGKDGRLVEEFQSDRAKARRSTAKAYAKDKFGKAIAKLSESQRLEAFAHADTVVSPAPFAKTEADSALAMFKRALRDAVLEGKTWIGWTDGAIQNDRYDLRKKVKAITVWKEDGAFVISVSPLEGVWREAARGVEKADLSDWLPQKIADKVKDEAGDQKFTGNDLKVGGKGMKGFYDEILVNEIGAYVKQWGVKVELSKDSGILKNREDSVEESLGEFQTEETARNWAKSHLKNDEWVVSQDGDSEPWIVYGQGDAHAAIWKVQITPEMAAEITERGQPAFSISKKKSLRMKMTRAEIIDAVEGSKDWKDFYERAKELLVEYFGKDAPLFERILSATSQASSVKSNVALALKAYGQIKRGDEFTGYLPAVIGNLENIRGDQALGGRKVGNYEAANAGDVSKVVVDRHVARMLFGTKSPSKAQFEKAERVLTEIANELGWEPREVQAAIWAASIRKSGLEPASYDQYLKRLKSEGTFDQRIGGTTRRRRGNQGDRGGGGSAARRSAGSAGFLNELWERTADREQGGNVSFSIEPKPYKERSGDEQGEPLTETEIREGIEDEPGTVGGIEIDDEAFSDDEGKSEEKATKAATQSDINFSVSRKIPYILRSSLKGKSKFIYFSDRTRVGIYEGLDPQSGISIDLQGGPAYPWMKDHKGAKAGWAFTIPKMFTRFNKRIAATDGIGLVTLYSKENLRANHTFLKAYVEEVKWAIKTKKITTRQFLDTANELRLAAVNSRKKGSPVIPVNSAAGKKFAKEWKTVASFASALGDATFDVRSGKFFGYSANKKGANKGSKIGSDALVDQGFPNISDMVDLFADPAFDGMETGTIVAAVQFEKGQKKPSTAKDIGAQEHLSYEVVTKGKPLGYFKNPISVTKLLGVPAGKSKRNVMRSAETSMAGAKFSISPATVVDELTSDLMARVRRPEIRATIMGSIARRLNGLRRDADKMVSAFGRTSVQRKIDDPRTLKSLKKEGAMREALRKEELIGELYERHGQALEDDTLTDLREQPIHSAIMNPANSMSPRKGRLISEAQATKDELFNPSVHGDYDGAGMAGRNLFGGTMMPNQMAKELFDDNLIEVESEDAMWEGLERELESVTRRKEDFKKAKEEVAKAQKTAKEETRVWLEEKTTEQSRNYNPMERLRRMLMNLDAIVTSLPMELRGKIGGHTQIAKLNSDEKRLEFLVGRLEKVDQVLEAWMKSEYRKQISDLIKAARPGKTAKGVPRSKLSAAYADRVLEIEAMSKLSKEEVDAKIEKIVEDMDAAADQEKSDELDLEMAELLAFGDIAGMSAQSLESFYANLLKTVNTGKMLKEVSDAEFKAEADEAKEMVNHDASGGGGRMTSTEAKAADKDRKLLKGANKFHRMNISFEWLLNVLARKNKGVGTMGSKTHDKFSRLVHIATHSEKRANMATRAAYNAAIGDILGVTGIPLSNAVWDFTQEVEMTGVMRTEYGGLGAYTVNKMKASNLEQAEALGLNAAERKSAKAEYERIREQLQDREDAKAAKAGREPVAVKVPGTRVIRYKTPNVGKPVNLTLSQDQAINLTMLYRQEGLTESMIHEGYTEETMAQMEDWLSPEAIQIRAWLTHQYAENYHIINDVFQAANGVSLPQTDLYSPARRLADKAPKTMQIDSQGRSAMSTNPNFTISRTKNFAEVDQTVGALAIYHQHMEQTNHYISWAKPIRLMRSVFSDKTVQKNISDHAGADLLAIIGERIDWMADGGNRSAAHHSLLDKMRSAHVYGALAYNWAVGVKQLTSLPAYAFDMNWKDFAKYSAQFLKNPAKHMLEIWKTDYAQTRFKEGYERDVVDGLSATAGEMFHHQAAYMLKGLQSGMVVTKVGDIIPIMIGGWMARKRSYDRNIAEGMSEADALEKATIDMEMISDRAQQASDLKDQSNFQAGGSIAKLFTMYKTSLRQYYANVYEAALDAEAGKKGSLKEFGRRFVIGQILLPLTFQFVSDLLKSPFNDDDDEDYDGADYIRAMILGPLNGLFIAGEAFSGAASMLSGSKIYEPSVPIYDGLFRTFKGASRWRNNDWQDAIDELLHGLGETVPSPFTYWSILTREAKKAGLQE